MCEKGLNQPCQVVVIDSSNENCSTLPGTLQPCDGAHVNNFNDCHNMYEFTPDDSTYTHCKPDYNSSSFDPVCKIGEEKLDCPESLALCPTLHGVQVDDCRISISEVSHENGSNTCENMYVIIPANEIFGESYVCCTVDAQSNYSKCDFGFKTSSVCPDVPDLNRDVCGFGKVADMQVNDCNLRISEFDIVNGSQSCENHYTYAKEGHRFCTTNPDVTSAWPTCKNGLLVDCNNLVNENIWTSCNGMRVMDLNYEEHRDSVALDCGDLDATTVAVYSDSGNDLMCTYLDARNFTVPHECPSAVNQTVLGVDYTYDVSAEYGVVHCGDCASTDGILKILNSEMIVYSNEPKCIVNVDDGSVSWCSLDGTYFDIDDV